MASSRRTLLVGALASTLLCSQDQDQSDPAQNPRLRLPDPNPDENRRLPNGKLQKDEIAKHEHEKALQDAQDLVSMAQQLRDELQKAGDFVVPMASVKRTEEIEKLARKIRGRLKD
jgi:hypothetical protein